MVKTMIELPLNEITLRKYERPESTSRRNLVKKLCLSLGLLQPGDSRDIIIDILYVLLRESRNEKFMSSEEIRAEVILLREKENLPKLGIAPSNIRRQLKRLRDIFIVEKIKNKYRITEFQPLEYIFQDKILQYLLPNIISRIKDHIKEVDSLQI